MYTANWFGDVDASRDKDLINCFVEINSHLYAMDYEINSIVAFKGIGKTAFLKELEYCSYKPTSCQMNCPLTTKLCERFNNYFVVPINVTNISFEVLLNIFNSTDPRKEITNILKVLIKVEFMNNFLQYLERTGDSDYENLKSKIKFEKYKDKTKNIINEILKSLEKNYIKGENISNAISDLFIEKGNIEDFYKIYIDKLEEKNIYSIIVLDQFDIIMDLFKKEDEASRFYFHQTIATSLLELLYDEENSNFPNERVQIKCLFPNDLYMILSPRDLQKYDKHMIDMKWTKDTLKLFLNKRIKNFLDDEIVLSSQKIFDKVFQKYINNTYFNKQEDTIDYILRHTLFRPRDVQELMISIVDSIIKNKTTPFKSKSDFIKSCTPFSPTNIKDGVREGTYHIIDYLVIEFETIKLKNILQSLKNKKNIMSYSDLYDILNKKEYLDKTITIDDYINRLYNIGIIGILQTGNDRLFQTYKNQTISTLLQNNDNEDKYYVSIFSFSWNNNNIKLVNGDTIVIAPMFTDYLNLNIDKNYMIYPF